MSLALVTFENNCRSCLALSDSSCALVIAAVRAIVRVCRSIAAVCCSTLAYSRSRCFCRSSLARAARSSAFLSAAACCASAGFCPSSWPFDFSTSSGPPVLVGIGVPWQAANISSVTVIVVRMGMVGSRPRESSGARRQRSTLASIPPGGGVDAAPGVDGLLAEVEEAAAPRLAREDREQVERLGAVGTGRDFVQVVARARQRGDAAHGDELIDGLAHLEAAALGQRVTDRLEVAHPELARQPEHDAVVAGVVVQRDRALRLDAELRDRDRQLPPQVACL